MNSKLSHPKRPRWPLIAAILAPPIVIGAILAPTLLSGSPSSQDMWVGAEDFGPTSTAPAADIQVIHNALHDIGAQCLEVNPDLDIIASDVDLIIAFSQSYPVGRFAIDDETATATSLLVVTREAVKECAPAQVERLNAAGQ